MKCKLFLVILIMVCLFSGLGFSETSGLLNVSNFTTNSSIVTGFGGSTISLAGYCNVSYDCGGLWNNWFRCALDYDTSYQGSQGNCTAVSDTRCLYNGVWVSSGDSRTVGTTKYTCSSGSWSSESVDNSSSTSSSSSTNASSYTTSITITAYPSEVNVTQGENISKIITVKNTGNSTISNVKLNLSGIESSWFSISPESFENITIGQSKIFSMTFSIPENTTIKTYTVTASVKEGSTEKATATFILNVLPNEKTINTSIIPLYNQYKAKYLELESNITSLGDKGYNVSNLTQKLAVIYEKLNQTNSSIASGNFFAANNLLGEIGELITSLESEMSGFTESGTDLTLVIIVILVVIALIIGVVFYLFIPSDKESENRMFPSGKGWRPQNIGNFFERVNNIKDAIRKKNEKQKFRYRYKSN